MDPHRHHEYLASSDDRTRPMYINHGAEPARGVTVAVGGSLDDVRSPHLQYYTSNRDLLVKKPARYGCTCNGSNTMCNGCRAANSTTSVTMARPTEESWASTPSSTRQSPIYINTNQHHHMSNSSSNSMSGSSSVINSRSSSYWPPEEHVMHRGVAVPTPSAYLDSRKPPLVQSSYQSYKSAPLSTTTITQVTQTTRPSAIKHYTNKERFYEETKYAMPSVVAATPNTKIPNYATTVSIYDVDGSHRPLEHPIQCNSVRSEHIINPSNALAPSEQQPSPNYARKCPQIYAPTLAPEQHATSHQSLYMATPQFSSEKFQTIAQSAILKYTRVSPQDHQPGCQSVAAAAVEFRGSGVHTLPESEPRIREGSPQPITHSAAYRATKPLQYLEQEPHLSARPATFATSAATGITTVNYYTQSNHHIHTEPGARNAEQTPVIMKSTPLAPASHYVQYSKSPLPQTAQYSTSGTEHRHDKVNYMKLENEPVTPSSNHNTFTSSRGLYHNPYKTPPPTENNCCKERASPYSNSPAHSYRGETPHGYPTKYSKLVQESNSMHKLNHHAHTPPPALQATSHISRSHATSAAGSSAATSRSHSASSSYYYGAQSPATASAASPSPQMHHAVYTATPPPSTIPPPPGASMVATQALSLQTSHAYPHPQQQQAPVIMPQGYTPSGDICCSTATLVPKTGVTSSGKQTIQATKKLQAPKPNYRELINELMIRNTASEEELNLQIIKKTLNVNSPQPVVRVPNNTTSVVVPIKPMQTTSGVIHQRTVQPPTAPLAPAPNVNQVISTTTSIIVPQIKQELIENKPAAYSPLDLSMRTVKTKADSTEYKFRHKNSVDYKHGLPRIDITPNFSAATVAQRLSTAPTAPSRNEQQAYTPPVKEHSQSSTTYNQEAYTHHYKTPQSGTTAILQLPSNSLVIKSTSRQQDIAHSQCARPSVLVEPNSYSKLTVASTRQMLAVEQLPPDTSIVVLPKSTPIQHQPNVQPTSNRTVAPPVPLVNDQVHPLRSKQPTQSAYINNNLVHSEQLNPNYLGRKRHLQEYSNANNKYNNNNNNNNTQEPYNKQPRHLSSTPHIVTTPQLLPRAAEIPVIAINEHALELERRRAMENLTEGGLSVSNSFHNDLPVSVTVSTICKQEPLTPTADSRTSPLPTSPALPPAPIKAERIRTKAELKGFTFNPPPVADSSTNQTQIKIEPDVLPATQAEGPSIPGLTDEYNSHCLLDIGWNNACNSFVEQLLTNSEKRQQQQEEPLQVRVSAIVTKVTLSSASDIKQELSEDDLPVAIIAQKKLNNESVEKLLPEIVVSTTTPPSVMLQKKLSKLDREKKRLVQEQRLAARLPDGSSSESDNELDKRKSERQKKPMRKGKTRRLQLEKTDKTNESSERAFYTSSELTDANSYKIPTEKRQQVFKTTPKTDDEKTITAEVLKSHKCESDKLKEIDRLNQSESVTSTNGKDKVQYSTSSNNCFKSMVSNEKNSLGEHKPSKHLSNKKLQTKIALNTMTRSKRKKELELQLANSKVLRNDKIIRNSTTKIKRKYVRKLAAVKEATKDVNVVGTRLRARKLNELPLNGRKLKTGTAACSGKAASEHNLKASAKSSKIQQQQNLYLEMYRFKRALKIPPSLITVENMNHHKIAASLPDLERGNALEELTGFKNATRRKPKTLKSIELRKTSKPCKESEAAPKSIIDVLHSRVTNSVGGNKLSATTTISSKAPSVVHNFSETSQNTESTSVYELPLPTPVRRPEDEFDVKRHFSIFDTKVLQSKTRTESKMQQKREIIREIFVGPDRPASAPPDMPRGDEISGDLDGSEFCTGEAFISYEKCEQFLEQMNKIIRQNKSKFTRVGSSTLTSMNIKKEELDDVECASAIDADEKHDNAMNHASNTPGVHLHRRKYLRRKGSSGFDYIRKKKKPSNNSTQANSNVLSVSMQNLHPTQIKIEKIDEDIDLDKTKTEDDVCREIQKWVLNKGVGQSTMHKAARQGYIDVVVYCLDRIGMNPNQKDNAGYTPLHEACTHGWLEIARILLQFGANHSEAAQAGIRPLHGAIENDHEEVVRLLLSYGADPLLATYSGQTPLMLASSKVMRGILGAHLSDAQSTANHIHPIRFPGPWEIFDSTEYGYDIFDNVPNIACDMSRALLRKRRSNGSTVLASNGFTNKLLTSNSASTSNIISNGENSTKTATTTKTDECTEDDNECNSGSDSEHEPNENELNENFEFEETDVLLPPLYLLKDEGSDKWVLLNDLCNLLKVKSKDTLLNKICPGSTSTSTMASAHKNLLREYKMSDFLEKATCMQLLCAGEKLNIGASKVVLIKYNESVKNLLGVKTILMKF